MKLLAAILMTFLAAGCGMIEYQVHGLVKDLRVSLRESDYVLRSANDGFIGVNSAASTLQAVTKQQGEQLNTEFRNSIKLTANAKHLVGTADLWLNGGAGRIGLFARADKILEGADSSVQLTNADLIALEQAIQSTNKLAADADAQVSAPEVKIALANLATSSDNLAKATTDGAASMADVRNAVHQEVTDLLKPVSKAKQVLYFAVTLLGRFLGY